MRASVYFSVLSGMPSSSTSSSLGGGGALGRGLTSEAGSIGNNQSGSSPGVASAPGAAAGGLDAAGLATDCGQMPPARPSSAQKPIDFARRFVFKAAPRVSG